MAHGSGIGTILGLGVAGVGVWWVGNMFGWWGGSTTVTAAPPTGGIIPSGTPMPTNPPPPATVTLNGSVSLVANNALKASFTINGVTQNIAVIPNGDAYNDSGQDITSTLAAQGVTPGQLYTLMSAKYTPTPAATQATNPPATGTPVVTWHPGLNLPGMVGTARRFGLRGVGYIPRGAGY